VATGQGDKEEKIMICDQLSNLTRTQQQPGSKGLTLALESRVRENRMHGLMRGGW